MKQLYLAISLLLIWPCSSRAESDPTIITAEEIPRNGRQFQTLQTRGATKQQNPEELVSGKKYYLVFGLILGLNHSHKQF
jgi:hypothetical protein